MSIGHPAVVSSGDNFSSRLYADPPAITPNRELRDLLLRSIKGDAHAFGLFNELTEPMVLEYLHYRTDDFALTAALAETAYLTAMKSVCAFQGSRMSGEAWILRIARDVASSQTSSRFGLAVTAYGTDNEQLIQAMKQLSSIRQECLVLRYFFRFDMKMICDTVGHTPAQVHTHLVTGLRGLAALMHPS